MAKKDMKKVWSEVSSYTGRFKTRAVQTAHFPHISRKFPATLLSRDLVLSQVFLISFACGFTLMGIALLSVQLRDSYKRLEIAKLAQKERYEQTAYWEEIVAKYPLYRDGYYKLAALALSLGDKQKANDSIEKAIQIDPRFPVGYRLQKEVERLF